MALRTLLFCSSFFFLVWTAQGQQRQDLWAMFKRVPFKEKLNQNFNLYFFYPEFTQELKALKGKEVVIKGFYIPLDSQPSQTLIISKYPMAECFFCGGAGPESVAVVYLKAKPPRLKMDQILEIKGILDLNGSDVEEMSFIIRNATII